MTRIVVYGNCQAGPIGRMIELATPGLVVLRVPPVHTIRTEKIGEVEGQFQSADIVLSQPIGSNFGALSSDALKALPGKREWITFPSIYFGGLFPYLHYLRQEGGAALKGPLSDYHDQRIVRAFLTDQTEAQCLQAIHTPQADLCASHFRDAVKESRRREESLPIKFVDYLMEHVAMERTFHTFNHPSNAVLWHVAMQFLGLIGRPIASNARPPRNQFLSDIAAAIPTEMTDAAGLRFIDNEYRIRGEPAAWKTLISGFYGVYSAIPGFAALCEKNGVA
jgi:hypothetical protein